MKFNPDIHHRRSVRLRHYDYSNAGAYFVTVCVQNRECLFGNVADGEIVLNDAGRLVQSVWDELPVNYPGLVIDQFVVMPNHVHGILIILGRGESCIRPHDLGDHKDRPYGTFDGTVGRIIQGFKSRTTHAYTVGVKQHDWPPFPGHLWQRNYYEHVIRNDDELRDIREYIAHNPAGWPDDENNPDAVPLQL